MQIIEISESSGLKISAQTSLPVPFVMEQPLMVLLYFDAELATHRP